MSKERIKISEDLYDIMPPDYQDLVKSATIGNTRLVQPVEPTITVSSGFGSEARIYRKAMDSGQPAHNECCSISSFDEPISFQPRSSLP